MNTNSKSCPAWEPGQGAQRKPPMTGPEADYRASVVVRLKQHFFLEEEVRGLHCSGRTFYLDAIVRPRDTTRWAREDVALGVEFKRIDPQGTASVTGAIAQAADYAHAEWKGYGRLFVFLCPGFRDYFAATRQQGSATVDVISRIAAQFGVGELRDVPQRGLCFLHSGGHVLWSERFGVEDAARHRLERRRKVGAR